MDQPLILLALAVSAIVNLTLLALYLYRLRHKKKVPPKLDQTAQELLHDLTHRGNALLRVEVLDAANLFMRRP